MNERANLEPLQKAASAAVAASILPSLPIKFLGRTFTVPSDQKYLETVFIPNNQEGAFWGSEKNYRGMFRLILHWPIDDKGAYGALDLASSIAGYFTKDRKLGGLQITEEPNLMSVIETDTDILYPMSVRYQRFASN